MTKLSLLTSITLLAAASAAVSAAGGAETPSEQLYKRNVLPVLKEYCYDCHAEGVDKGNFTLDQHPDYGALLKDHKLWGDVQEHVSTHVMPPDGKPAPTQAQRDMILNWIEDAVFAVDPNKVDPGHITLRRLNRNEYNNSIRDVFKSDLRPADRFPPDDTGYGFDNIGDVLSISPILMEKYLRAARSIVQTAVWCRPADRILVEKNGADFQQLDGTSQATEGIRWIYTNGGIVTGFKTPWDAYFRMTIHLSANQCGAEKAKFVVLLDNKEIHSGEVTQEYDPGAPNDHWQRFAWDQRVPGGDHSLVIRFTNDFADPKDPNPRRRDRNLAVESLSVDGPLSFRSPQSSQFIYGLFDNKPFMAPVIVFSGEDFDSGDGINEFSESRAMMATNGYIHRSVDIPADGHYRLRLKARPDQAGTDFVQVGVKVGATDLGKHEVKGKTKEVQYLTVEANLKKGPQDLQVAFLNDFYNPKNGEDRNVGIEEVTLEGPLASQEGLSDDQYRAFISKLGLRLFRRPMEEGELTRLMSLVGQFKQEGNTSVDILVELTEALLCSPKFLFRGGASGVGAPDRGSVLVDEYTLASRLSYFIWSSCPDEELLRLASEGQLRKNLPQQLKRMISDWKGVAFTQNFAGQWLQLRDVNLVSPDQKRFPEFTGKLATDFKKESELYFEHILKDNRSVLEFLDSDYSFLNERLAKFYGVSNVKGTEFRQVSLAGTPRGGILTQGSILAITSHPTRTSPVKRGKFLLEQLLGTPPPPPPANVPPLAESHRGSKLVGTLRQRMEQHRSNKSCAACHAFLDPMGFAFEHFDAIGRWRDTDNSDKIDATGKLITGESFDGVAELRKVLASDKKKEFLKCLTENLMTYALGRGIDYNDKPARDDVMRRTEASGYKFQDLVLAVCESVPFQRIRAEEAHQVAEK